MVQDSWRQATTWGAVLAGIFSVGCRCPSFSDMTVTNPQGLATEADAVQFSQAIARFERWTGWRTVCVPELQVQGELRSGRIIGLYQGPRQPILLATGSGFDTAVHEMCHAADERLGWLSMEHPADYPVTHIDPVSYTSRMSQIRESFARACEAGPGGLSLVRAMEQRCGVPIEHPGYERVLDEVYENVGVLTAAAPLGTLSWTTWGLSALLGDGLLIDAASGGTHVWLLVEDPPPPDPEPALEAVRPLRRLRVVGVDPRTGAATASITLLRQVAYKEGSDPLRAFRFLDSVGDPVLVESGSESHAVMWRVDEGQGVLERLPDAQVSLGADYSPEVGGGAVVDGVALWRWVGRAPDGVPETTEAGVVGWVAVELESGRVVDDHPVYDTFPGGFSSVQLRTTATLNGVAQARSTGTAVGARPAGVTELSADGKLSTHRLGAAGVSEPVAVTPSGEAVAVWVNGEIWHTVDWRRHLVVRAAEGGGWYVPEDVCAPADSDFVVLRGMHIADELWLLGYANGSDRRLQLRGLTLTGL